MLSLADMLNDLELQQWFVLYAHISPYSVPLSASIEYLWLPWQQWQW